ncbi:reverse transcriptase domain-containing protein, partial [Tanacetum coccineum]
IIPPRKAPETRTTPATTTNTTSVTNAQLQVMIDQGITATLAACDANRSTNGEDSHNSGTGVRRTERVAQDNCTVENQVKFSTCTLLGVALTWWNSHVSTVGHDVAYAMTWTDLKKKMTDKYCPRCEIKKLKAELWNLKVKGTNVLGYNQHFQELTLLCVRIFLEESDKVERYVGGLPDTIHRSVVASKPKTMQEAIEMATELMDKKISTWAERQNIRRAYTAGSGEKKLYGGSKPYALNVIITTMVHVLPNATSAIELATWPVTVGVPPMPTLPTTKGALGQARNLLAMNVEPRDISKGTVES